MTRHADGAQAEGTAGVGKDSTLVFGRRAAELDGNGATRHAPGVRHPSGEIEVRRRELIRFVQRVEQPREACLARLDASEVVEDPLFEAEWAGGEGRARENVDEAMVPERPVG